MKTRHLVFGLALSLAATILAVSAQTNDNDSRPGRKGRRAAEAAATARTVDSILVAKRFLFVPTRVVTQMPGMPYVTLNTYYEVAVTPDSLVCSLPYYGYVYNTILDPDRSPFYFTAVRPDIRMQSLPDGKKKGWVVINAREQYNQRSYVLTFETFSNGSASLTIQGAGTQHLQYLGNLFPIPRGEAAAINPEMR